MLYEVAGSIGLAYSGKNCANIDVGIAARVLFILLYISADGP